MRTRVPPAPRMEGRTGHQPGSRWNGGCSLVLEAVGNGAFGTVWRSVESSSGQIVAIKRVALDDRYQNRELSVMQELAHPNIIRLHDHFFTREEVQSKNRTPTVCPIRTCIGACVPPRSWRYNYCPLAVKPPRSAASPFARVYMQSRRARCTCVLTPPHTNASRERAGCTS